MWRYPLFRAFSHCAPSPAGVLDGMGVGKGGSVSDAAVYFTPAVYDDEFHGRLSKQINVHFQLLVQSLALAGELRDADQVWVTCLKMMVCCGEPVARHRSTCCAV